VHPAVPAQNLNELIAYTKANPGKLSYGHSGVGSIQHLAGELFKSLAGTLDIVQVPYRGTGPLITDLVGGQIPMGTPGVTGQVIEFHRSGKMRVLMVTSPARLNAAPELPTAAELGFAGMTVMGSIGLLAPAGTPIGIIEQIAQATRTIVAESAFQRMLIDAGIEPTLDSSPRKIPAVARSRCCALDAGRQSARAENRLSTRGDIPSAPLGAFRAKTIEWSLCLPAERVRATTPTRSPYRAAPARIAPQTSAHTSAAPTESG
jgi:hypothetical protein